MVAEVTKPDFSYVWASGGAVVMPSNVKTQTGWTAEVPPFQWENALQNRQDNAIVHLFQKGISVWDVNSNYYFTTDGPRSYVQGPDGKVYVAVQSNIGQNPATDVSKTYWKVAFADTDSVYLTQTAGDARYPQKANNLSDLTNVTTARTNLGLDSFTQSGIAGSSSGLKVSATGLSALVTVAAISICVKSSTNSQIVLNNVAENPSIASSGANGLDTGTSAASTWYSVWVIWNGTRTAGLLSLSATAPTMPAGYTHKARVGWVRTDSTANKFPLSFGQDGDKVFYVPAAGTNLLSPPSMAAGVLGNVNTPTWSPFSVDAFIPPTASIVKFFTAAYAQGIVYMVADSNAYGVYNSATNPPPVMHNTASPGGDFIQFMSSLRVGPTRSLFCASNTAAFNIRCLGWEDNL